MSKKLLMAGGVLTSLVMLAGTTYSFGQEANVNVRSNAKATQVRRTSMIIGANVKLQGGVAGGQVADIVLNDMGCVDYIVVSYERKYVIVPWTVADVDFGSRFVTLNIARDRFITAPSFTGNQWPDLTDAQFTQKINTVFNVDVNRRNGRDRLDAGRSRRDQGTTEQDRARSNEERKSFERLQQQTDGNRRKLQQKNLNRNNDNLDQPQRKRQSDQSGTQNRQSEQSDRKNRQSDQSGNQDQKSDQQQGRQSEKPDRQNEKEDK